MRNRSMVFLSLIWVLAFSAWENSGKAVRPLLHYGMCDASAGAALDPLRFAVANNEDNLIRVFRTDRDGLPAATLDLSDFLGVRKSQETDLEGAARMGNRIYWISSHGRNEEGKRRPNRHRFFALEIVDPERGLLKPVGRPYTSLLDDLSHDPQLGAFHLRAASQIAPKLPGGLNIEGLCVTPDERLLIGFRNPLPGGRALIVPLNNPGDLVEGKAAHFGPPVLLDLGGLGIRGMARRRDRYLIIGGSVDGSRPSRFFWWDGHSSKLEDGAIVGADLLNPEAVISYSDESNRVLVLSDDGALKLHGRKCKDLQDSSLKRFRSLWATLSVVGNEHDPEAHE